MRFLERFQRLFQPKHTLRPTQGRRSFESTVRHVRVHVSVAKLYEAPLRLQPAPPPPHGVPPPPTGFAPPQPSVRRGSFRPFFGWPCAT